MKSVGGKRGKSISIYLTSITYDPYEQNKFPQAGMRICEVVYLLENNCVDRFQPLTLKSISNLSFLPSVCSRPILIFIVHFMMAT